ncbi:hypothetical protein J3459_002403 [Metarhizium acridum]|nr:hypothetical protein J3459_002403 [Metarhizium acridum]
MLTFMMRCGQGLGDCQRDNSKSIANGKGIRERDGQRTGRGTAFAWGCRKRTAHDRAGTMTKRPVAGEDGYARWEVDSVKAGWQSVEAASQAKTPGATFLQDDPALASTQEPGQVKTASLGAVCRGTAADAAPVDRKLGNLGTSDLLVEAARASGWEAPGQSEPHVDPHEQKGSFPPEQQRQGMGPGKKVRAAVPSRGWRLTS